MDYKNGKIYRLVFNEKQYIGATTQPLHKRKHQHKENWKSGEQKYKSSILYNEANKFGGNVEIILIEEYPCNNKQQLESRERYWIERLDCVNKIIPTRTKKEYYENNKKRF